jgi:hypothetical protein
MAVKRARLRRDTLHGDQMAKQQHSIDDTLKALTLERARTGRQLLVVASTSEAVSRTCPSYNVHAISDVATS